MSVGPQCPCRYELHYFAVLSLPLSVMWVPWCTLACEFLKVPQTELGVFYNSLLQIVFKTFPASHVPWPLSLPLDFYLKVFYCLNTYKMHYSRISLHTLLLCLVCDIWYDDTVKSRDSLFVCLFSQSNVIEAGPNMQRESEKEWYYGNADKERLGPYSYEEVGNISNFHANCLFHLL